MNARVDVLRKFFGADENGSWSAVAPCCSVSTARKVLGISVKSTERESEIYKFIC